MFGFAQTPHRPPAHQPSHGSHTPLSGTVGYPPHHGKRRSASNVTAAVTSPTSSNNGGGRTSDTTGSAGMPPLEKLEALTEQIRMVLKAYSALPTRSLVYLASIKEFLRRAKELNPNAIDETDEETASTAACPPVHRSMYLALPSPTRHRRSGSARKVLLLPSRRDVYRIAPDVAEVDKLDREWWASDIVAVWYGPRPGARAVSERARTRRESIKGSKINRDASFVGLFDDGVKE